jgi:hypothetical protein
VDNYILCSAFGPEEWELCNQASRKCLGRFYDHTGKDHDDKCIGLCSEHQAEKDSKRPGTFFYGPFWEEDWLNGERTERVYHFLGKKKSGPPGFRPRWIEMRVKEGLFDKSVGRTFSGKLKDQLSLIERGGPLECNFFVLDGQYMEIDDWWGWGEG